MRETYVQKKSGHSEYKLDALSSWPTGAFRRQCLLLIDQANPAECFST